MAEQRELPLSFPELSPEAPFIPVRMVSEYVDGPMRSPDGRTPRVRTVWIVEPEHPGPRLVTAHPL